MLCETCEKREYCTELCPEAEAYVNQDHVPQKHLIPSKPIKLSMEDWYEQNTTWDYSGDKYTSSELKELIIKLHKDGLNQLEIAYHLPCSQQYIQQITSKIKTNLP